ncbi:MAG: helix-turn-helix domain-containing protein, partial [Treponema sp.]|nr:helix-turn-helix domain-containing protein [Treponema sp.]
ADKKTKVLDAQLDTGYSSSGTFSKFFSRFTGLSPKQFQTEMKGLYTGLKKHEEKEEEGAIHYPPLSKNCNTKYKCYTHIIAPENFNGIIFVGLFDKPLSNKPPIIGKAMVKSRICAFEDTVSPGNYYVLVCAIEYSVYS